MLQTQRFKFSYEMLASEIWDLQMPSQMAQQVKTLSAMQKVQFHSIPGSEKIPRRRKWRPTSVFLPGKFHRQRSLAGYSPWGCKESDMTERLTLILRMHFPAMVFLIIIAPSNSLFPFKSKFSFLVLWFAYGPP